MTVKQALFKYRKVEIDLLLSFVLKKTREFLFMHPEYRMSENQTISLLKMIERRQKGEPMAYILGYKDFMGHRFRVNKHVLIPRPETEWMVERIMKYELGSMNGKPIRILDVGTGSGCVAVSLAEKLQNLNVKHQITASDVSKKALKVARQNAKIFLNNFYHHTLPYDSKIKFIHSDILQNVRMSFDIIIANLPYGWKAWKNNTSAETIGLKFEPQNSLFTEEDGLMLIRKFLMQVALLKEKPQLIFLEHDSRQKKALSAIIKKYLPSSRIKFHKDFNGLWRYMEIRFKHSIPIL